MMHARRGGVVAASKRGKHCKYCLEDHPAALDYHHRDPRTKQFSLREAAHHPVAEILAEIEKCDLVCSNCHRKYHYAESHRKITLLGTPRRKAA